MSERASARATCDLRRRRYAPSMGSVSRALVVASIAAASAPIHASAAEDRGAFLRLDVGVIVEHEAYRRVDRAVAIGGFPPPTAYVDRTQSSTSVGAPLRIDLGAALGRGVVLAASAHLALLDVASGGGGFHYAGVIGYGHFGIGISSIWYPPARPRLHVRIGCLYAISAQGSSGSEVGAYDNTYDNEQQRGVDCHVGGGWDLVHTPSFRIGPAIRVDAGRLTNGRSDGASTLTLLSTSLTLGITWGAR